MENVKIKDFRELAGITQEDLGQFIGVRRQTIAAWETGETIPGTLQLFKIAEYLNVPVALLLGEQPAQETGLLFRADDPSLLTPEIRALLTRKATDYAHLEHLLSEVPALPEARPLDEDDEYVVMETASTIRDWLGVGDTSPLRDLFALMENKGLKVIRYPLPDVISGFSAYTEEFGALIVVNTTHPTERQLLTALHELAHLIFHRREYVAGKAIKTKYRDPREKSANRLAVAVMLPDKVLRSELHAFENRWIPEPLLRDMKQRYYVSMQTILVRAAQSGLITDKQAGAQIGYIKKHKLDETFALPPLLITLDRLKRLTFTALINEEITASRAAEILETPLTEIREELSRWTGGGACAA